MATAINYESFYSALKKAIADYDAKQRAGNATDKTLFTRVDELSRMNELSQNLHVDVSTTIEHLEDRSMS